MILSTDRYLISRRYANSLFEDALAAKSINGVLVDLKEMQVLLEEAPDFRMLMESSAISGAKKREISNLICKKSAWKKLTVSFLNLLIDHKRENYLPYIIQAFLNKYDNFHDIEKWEIASHRALSAAEASALTKKISSRKGAKNVKTHFTIDPSLIGGFTIKTSDKLLDCSLKGKLSSLKEQFSENLKYV